MRRPIPLKLAPLLIALCLVLSACVRTHTTIQVHPADLISFDVQFRMDKDFARQTGSSPESITEQAKSRLPEAAQAIATFTPIDEAEWVGTHATTVPLPAAQVSEFVQYTRDGSTAKLVLPLEKYSALGQFGDVTDLKSTGVEARVSVVLPGKILGTNGVISGNSVTWDLLAMDSDPWVEAQVGMEWWLIALIAVAVIFGVILVVWGLAKVFRRPRRYPQYQPDRP